MSRGGAEARTTLSRSTLLFPILFISSPLGIMSAIETTFARERTSPISTSEAPSPERKRGKSGWTNWFAKPIARFSAKRSQSSLFRPSMTGDDEPHTNKKGSRPPAR